MRYFCSAAPSTKGTREPMGSQSPLQVRLIGKANGVGLSRDFELLAAALRACGCEVTLYGCERRDRKRRRSRLTRLAGRARARGAIPGSRSAHRRALRCQSDARARLAAVSAPGRSQRAGAESRVV